VIAKLIKDSGMLDENRLEGRSVAWDLMVQHFVVPFAEEPLQL
jgi:hypothetical protein